MTKKETTKNTDGTDKIIVGRTLVECIAIGDDSREGVAKQGVVSQNFGTFVRVYDFRSAAKGGDCHFNTEVWAMKARRGYVKIVGELEEASAIRIPASF